jgi:hypothetical protein
MSAREPGISQEESYTNSAAGSAEPYFEETKKILGGLFAKIFLTFVVLGSITLGAVLVMSSNINVFAGGLAVAVLLLLGITFYNAKYQTIVDSDRIVQKSVFLSTNRTTISPSEIVGCYLVSRKGVEGIDPDMLPYLTQKLVGWDTVTGVYIETNGDQPEFTGIIKNPS